MKRETILLSITVVSVVIVLFCGTFWMMRPHPATALGTNPDPSHSAMMGHPRQKGGD